MNNHEIGYKLCRIDMQFVEVELDLQETVVVEANALMMIEDGIEMETTSGDIVDLSGGGLMGAGKRILTGESHFMTTFTNTGSGKKHVSFTSPYPDKIIPMNLSEHNSKIIC